MSDPDAQDRVEDLKGAALDAIRAIEEAIHTAGQDPKAVLALHDVAKSLRRALDRFVADTQPLDPPPPRDTGDP